MLAQHFLEPNAAAMSYREDVKG